MGAQPVEKGVGAAPRFVQRTVSALVPCRGERAGDPFRSVGRVCRRRVDFDAIPGGDWMMACYAVRLLGSAPKGRISAPTQNTMKAMEVS